MDATSVVMRALEQDRGLTLDEIAAKVDLPVSAVRDAVRDLERIGVAAARPRSPARV